MASTITKTDKQEMALVQLALQISKAPDGAVTGDLPTDEEFSALYENRLDVKRRAQLLSYIANSSVIHERWIRCVESLAYIDGINSVTTESTESTVEESVGFIKKVTNWLSGFLTTRYVLSGGLSTAVVLVLVIYLLPLQRGINIDMYIDSTYAGWGMSLENEWSTLPASKKPKPHYSTDRSFFSESEKKSTIQQVLETGFKASMSQIGIMPFKDYGINITSLSSVENDEVSNTLTVSQYDAIKQIGQLAAIAAIQCKIDSSGERIVELTSVLVQLRKQLFDNPSENSAALVSGMGADTKVIVCLTAQYVIDEIIIK